MNTTLEIIIQAVDEASQALQNIGNNITADGDKALTAQEKMKQMGVAMQQAGMQLLAVGASADAFYAGAVDAASKVQDAQDSLSTSIQNLVKQSKESMGADSGVAQQKAFLTTKIKEAEASIAKLSSETETSIKLGKDHGATNEANAAKVEMLRQNVAKYQGQLDQLNNVQSLAGASAQDLLSAFESLAAKNTSLGFSIQDSTNALNGLFTETKSMPETFQAYNAAMDLARFKHMDLETATKQVEMALQGQGRALATLGIQIKDGLTPLQALEALQSQVKGQAQAYADTLAGKTAVALQSINKLFADMGNTQLPILAKILDGLAGIIDKVDAWTTAHPQLTAAILASIGVFGALATVAGTLLVIMGTLAIAFGTAGIAIGIWAFAIIAAVAILAGIVVLIIEYHTQIWNFMQAVWAKITGFLSDTWKKITDAWNTMWTLVKRLVQDVLNFISDLIIGTIGAIATVWNATWQGIGDFFTGIWNGIKGTLSIAINFVTSQLNSLLSFVSNIAGAISAPIQSVGNLVSSIASTASKIGSAVSSAVTKSVPHFAAGGIVSSPTFALVGEAGPEAIIPLSMLGGGSVAPIGRGLSSGGINIYLSGTFYTDEQAGTRLGNAIAKVLNQQLKLKNF
jgi:phage-related protein